MNIARIVVLTVALGAGGAAAYLASGIGNNSQKPPAPVVQKPAIETTDILVAHADIGLGQTIKPDDLKWQPWPTSAANASFIKRNDKPDAQTEFAGSIARSPFVAGEPIRETKLVKANGSGFMAAILPTGMRAVSTEISAETGAGGFILPNDKVDVILTKRDKGNGDDIRSELILSNIRVLAIDQTFAEKDGQKVVVGKTATLELNPEQAEILARSRQSGTLSLALRSLADANRVDTAASRDTVNITRYGESTAIMTRK